MFGDENKECFSFEKFEFKFCQDGLKSFWELAQD